MQNRTTHASAAFLRIAQIIGDPAAKPPIPPRIPIGRSTWWKWVRDGKAPKPVKLSTRTTAWRGADIDELIAILNAGDATTAGDE